MEKVDQQTQAPLLHPLSPSSYNIMQPSRFNHERSASSPSSSTAPSELPASSPPSFRRRGAIRGRNDQFASISSSTYRIYPQSATAKSQRSLSSSTSSTTASSPLTASPVPSPAGNPRLPFAGAPRSLPTSSSMPVLNSTRTRTQSVGANVAVQRDADPRVVALRSQVASLRDSLCSSVLLDEIAEEETGSEKKEPQQAGLELASALSEKQSSTALVNHGTAKGESVPGIQPSESDLHVTTLEIHPLLRPFSPSRPPPPPPRVPPHSLNTSSNLNSITIPELPSTPPPTPVKSVTAAIIPHYGAYDPPAYQQPFPPRTLSTLPSPASTTQTIDVPKKSSPQLIDVPKESSPTLSDRSHHLRSLLDALQRSELELGFLEAEEGVAWIRESPEQQSQLHSQTHSHQQIPSHSHPHQPQQSSVLAGRKSQVGAMSDSGSGSGSGEIWIGLDADLASHYHELEAGHVAGPSTATPADEEAEKVVIGNEHRGRGGEDALGRSQPDHRSDSRLWDDRSEQVHSDDDSDSGSEQLDIDFEKPLPLKLKGKNRMSLSTCWSDDEGEVHHKTNKMMGANDIDECIADISGNKEAQEDIKKAREGKAAAVYDDSSSTYYAQGGRGLPNHTTALEAPNRHAPAVPKHMGSSPKLPIVYGPHHSTLDHPESSTPRPSTPSNGPPRLADIPSMRILAQNLDPSFLAYLRGEDTSEDEEEEKSDNKHSVDAFLRKAEEQLLSPRSDGRRDQAMVRELEALAAAGDGGRGSQDRARCGGDQARRILGAYHNRKRPARTAGAPTGRTTAAEGRDKPFPQPPMPPELLAHLQARGMGAAAAAVSARGGGGPRAPSRSGAGSVGVAAQGERLLAKGGTVVRGWVAAGAEKIASAGRAAGKGKGKGRER
ncbi:MAG: geranylgeranyl pyrophosphate synthetase [Chaenotheca gracillima]|nr:MAG: geranylgeranyl pyrophosphate synthetase [Chaenotheca gracillima]